MKKILLALGLMLICPQFASAQSQRNPCYYKTGSTTSCIPVGTDDPLPVTGSINASLGGFHWEATLTPVAASTTPATTTITAGKTIVIQNIGATNSAYCALGGTTSANATAVPPNSSVSLISVGETSLTCVTSTSTTTLNLQSGTGLWSNFGGGSSGGGGGGTSSTFDVAFPSTGTAIGLSDGTNMKSWLTALIQTKTAVNGNNMGSVAAWLWNGASFDAATGTAALGQYVQAKSGAYAAGALAAGAFAAGAGVDGWDLTQGAKADAACSTATGTCSVVSLLKYLNNVAGQAVPVAVNGTATGLTGLTPGVAQTGTIVAANVDLTSKGGIAYGAMANYGTSPGAVKVDGVNAFVTNTVAANITQVLGSTISATNGSFTNLLVGNAAVAVGTGAQGASSPRVTVATDSATVAGSASLPAGTNTIGNTGSDPSSGKATPTEAFLALPATTTTQIIALSGSTKTYITSAVVLAGGTVNVTFKYGTGANCGTGTTTLNGPWPLTAQAGFSKGSGLGAVMIVPAGQALCITTDASVAGGVDLTYQQF